MIIEAWRRHYNEVRPHSSLGYLDAERVRGSRSKTSAPSGNGPGRCGTWGLRAPARCSTVPPGTNAASEGSRLKLTVVRKIRAGQSREAGVSNSKEVHTGVGRGKARELNWTLYW